MTENMVSLDLDEPGIQVTSTDLKTGESETAVIYNNYVIVCAGDCYISDVSTYSGGTAVVTIKRHGRGFVYLPDDDAPPVNEPEPVDDEALVKVALDWLAESMKYDSREEAVRELVKRLYAKVVQA